MNCVVCGKESGDHKTCSRECLSKRLSETSRKNRKNLHGIKAEDRRDALRDFVDQKNEIPDI